MLKILKQAVDRKAIVIAAKSLPQGSSKPDGVRQASAMLRDPTFLQLPHQIAELERNDKSEFWFTSPIQTPQLKNNTVYGKLFLTPKNWALRPIVILVHGWNAELHYLYVLTRLGRALNRLGLNAALIELPYHLHRRPREKDCMSDFISDDLVGMLNATRQALAEFDALGRWAKAQGCPSVGIWGFSLGAWLAGLYIGQTDLPKAAILMTPVIDLARAVKELAFCHPIQSGMATEHLDLSPLNLQNQHLQISPAAVQLVESAHDLFVPTYTYSDLATAWNLPRWEKQPQGHISLLLSRKAMRGSIDFLVQQL